MTIADKILMEYNTLRHEGMPHVGARSRSGRYPWGSGENPYQHDDWFDTPGGWLNRVKQYEKAGVKQSDLAAKWGLRTDEFRAYRSIAVREQKLAECKNIQQMLDAGKTTTEIAREFGIAESSVRSKMDWMKKQQEPNAESARNTAEYLKKAIDDLGGSIDIGEGVARRLGISNEKLEAALALMENEGYTIRGGRMDRVTDPTSSHKITLRVIGKGELPKDYVYNNLDDIHSLNELKTRLTEDGEKERPSFVFPESMDISRLKIIHGDEDGLDPGIKGIDRDGLVEIRRGVKDLDLGLSNYAQVRILVDGDRYIKGMAVYRDPADMPDGIDVVFNTNKPSSKSDREILKKVKTLPDGTIDPDNPFGALLREEGGQTFYDDPNGKYIDPVTGKKQSLNLINKTRIEGDWSEWADKVPAQMLSKQPKKLVEMQLKSSIDDRQYEFDEIMEITNPTVKRDQLLKFADSCDTASVKLKAAAFPGQKYQVLLPAATLKDNEVYAPNYQEGSQVALIRFPHGGTFEIPILTVNNKNAEARKMLSSSPIDAVAVNPHNAGILSGADFDGDTVQVIPMSDKVNIQNSRPLPGLVGFDPKVQYGTDPNNREGVRLMKREETDPKTGKTKIIDNTQKEMGAITNLITDMSSQNAPRDEIERAVRHSMVVIDAAKHELDYKRSEIDNGIAELKKKWQGRIDPKTGKYTESSATIMSRASAEDSEPRTIGSGWIDKETGKMVYKIDKTPNKQGKQRMQKTTQMMTTDDAFTLVHDNSNPIEIAYAKYANKLKEFARTARLASLKVGEKKRDPGAAKVYAKEVSSLKEKLAKALSNQDVERWAQLTANQKVLARRKADPDLDQDKPRLKKLRQKYLAQARDQTGAKRHTIDITDREWEAIQRGAVGSSTITTILKYSDPDRIKQLSMPRDSKKLNNSRRSRAKSMASQGFTQEQIASRLGVSTSTINDILKGNG